MVIGNYNECVRLRNIVQQRTQRFFLKAAGLIAFLALLCETNRGTGAEASFTEYQVKAVFLLNFAKYTAWPSGAFADDNTPITIGVFGEDKFGDHLKTTIKGKNIDGREIALRRIEKAEDFAKCQILFVSLSEKKRLPEILGRTKTLPVLTVGEAEPFLENGGIINFIKKGDKVRLEISVAAARQAGLQISSKLLSVADVVREKP